MTGTLPALKKVSCNLQDACDAVASVLTFAELLATASQSPKHLQSSLRRRRKRPFFCRVVCDGVASVLFFAEFFATASQTSCFLQSSLRRRRKLLCKLQETIFRLYCTFNINKTSNPKNIP